MGFDTTQVSNQIPHFWVISLIPCFQFSLSPPKPSSSPGRQHGIVGWRKRSISSAWRSVSKSWSHKTRNSLMSWKSWKSSTSNIKKTTLIRIYEERNERLLMMILVWDRPDTECCAITVCVCLYADRRERETRHDHWFGSRTLVQTDQQTPAPGELPYPKVGRGLKSRQSPLHVAMSTGLWRGYHSAPSILTVVH